MGIVLGDNRYGKAETHVVRVVRDTPRHEIRDLVVSTALRGDFAAAHDSGDQAAVLPTDTQKNTVLAYAKEVGVASPEAFATALARHFVDDVAPVSSARVAVDEHAWDRASVDGAPHDHTFVRRGTDVRTAAVTAESRHDARGVRAARPGAAQVDRLGVPRLPHRLLHDAGSRRPTG